MNIKFKMMLMIACLILSTIAQAHYKGLSVYETLASEINECNSDWQQRDLRLIARGIDRQYQIYRQIKDDEPSELDYFRMQFELISNRNRWVEKLLIIKQRNNFDGLCFDISSQLVDEINRLRDLDSNLEVLRINQETQRINQETQYMNQEALRTNQEALRTNQEALRTNQETQRMNQENLRRVEEVREMLELRIQNSSISAEQYNEHRQELDDIERNIINNQEVDNTEVNRQ